MNTAIFSCLAVPDSLQAHDLYPARHLCPWGLSPWKIIGKNIGVGCYPLLQGIFPTHGSNPGLLHCRPILYHLSHHGSPDEARNTEVHVSFQSMIFSWYISRWLQLFKRHRWKNAQEKAYRAESKEMWDMELGFLFPGCQRQLCAPSTDVPALSTSRHGSSLQAPCPEILLGLHRQGMTDGPYSWSQAQTSLEVQLILQDQNPHPESHHSCGPKFLL